MEQRGGWQWRGERGSELSCHVVLAIVEMDQALQH